MMWAGPGQPMDQAASNANYVIGMFQHAFEEDKEEGKKLTWPRKRGCLASYCRSMVVRDGRVTVVHGGVALDAGEEVAGVGSLRVDA